MELKTLWTLLGNPFDNSQEMLEWIPKKSSGASVCTFFWNPFQNSQEIFTQIHRKSYWICWEISWKCPDRFKVLVKIGQGSGAPWSFKHPEAPEPVPKLESENSQEIPQLIQYIFRWICVNISWEFGNGFPKSTNVCPWTFFGNPFQHFLGIVQWIPKQAPNCFLNSTILKT